MDKLCFPHLYIRFELLKMEKYITKPNIFLISILVDNPIEIHVSPTIERRLTN